MEPIETHTFKNHTINIYHDCDTTNPLLEDPANNLGTLITWHSRYDLGHQNCSKGGFEPNEFLEIANRRKYLKLPVYLYDHSGLTVNTTGFSCPWDSGQLGWIFVDRVKAREWLQVKRLGKKAQESIYKCLRAEIEMLDTYLRNDVYGYQVENDEGEIIDSCWGFYEQGGLNENSDVLKEAMGSINA